METIQLHGEERVDGRLLLDAYIPAEYGAQCVMVRQADERLYDAIIIWLLVNSLTVLRYME